VKARDVPTEPVRISHPMDRCACGHTWLVHEPHCVVTYYAAKRSCPDNCREFVPIEEEP